MFLKSFLISFLLQQNNVPLKKIYNNVLFGEPLIIPYKYNLITNNVSGHDMTYNGNETNENLVILNITRFYRQMDLLNKLENPNISQQYKLRAIEEYNNNNNPSKYLPNIKAGGLFNDWE
jgi:hypothetical protein